MTDERVRQIGRVNRLLTRPEFGAFLALVVVWLFFAAVAFDNNFVSWTTTASILNRAAPLGILAVGVSLLMIAGEFDLSIGSIVGFAGMAIMLLITPADAGGFGLPVWIAVIIALLITMLTGFFNGVLVMATKLPSFIITLGSLFIVRGLAVAIPRLMTNRTQLGGFSDFDAGGWAALFGTKIELGGARFDISIIWWFALAAIATIVLLRTQVGNWIFGAGGDANAARNVGVPVARLKIALFIITAVAAFLVALIQVSQLDSADSLRGTLKEFEAIIAVVVGGTLLTGGYGSVIGPVFGALIFAMVQQGIIITGVDGDWFRVFVGGILVLAVIFNNYIRQRASKR